MTAPQIAWFGERGEAAAMLEACGFRLTADAAPQSTVLGVVIVCPPADETKLHPSFQTLPALQSLGMKFSSRLVLVLDRFHDSRRRAVVGSVAYGNPAAKPTGERRPTDGWQINDYAWARWAVHRYS